MKHKGYTVSLVFFFMLLGVYCVVDSRKTSKIDTSSRMRRSILEYDDIGQIEDTCADIIGPKWNMGKEENTPCPILQVFVPKRAGFPEFIKVDDNLKVEDGFCIAVFCYALQALPFLVQPNFTAIDTGNTTFDQHIYQFDIGDTNCSAVAADITIRSSRAQNVSFTVPYLSSEVYMLVHATHEWNQTLWTFLRPFTTRLWIAILCTCFSTGLALSILEYRAHNPEFKSPFYSNIILVFWYPISAFFFQEGKIRNRCSKVVLVMWLSMIFIVLQIFTATLSSWLTLNQLHLRMPPIKKIGYQDCSFLKELILQKYNGSDKILIPLKDVEDYKRALSTGRVDVVFDELPYIQLFLNKYGSDYMKIGPINYESGIAFAFSHGSPLLQSFSRAVMIVTESDNMLKMMEKYLGYSTQYKSQPDHDLPQSLDVQSFYGLFIIMGIVTIMAMISSEISLMRRKTKVGDVEEEPKQEATLIVVKKFVIFIGIVTRAAIISIKNYLLPTNNKTQDEKEELKEQATISE